MAAMGLNRGASEGVGRDDVMDGGRDTMVVVD